MKRITPFVWLILLMLAVLLVWSMAGAQTALDDIEAKVGIPSGLLVTLIGYLASMLVIPLTALAKKLGQTKGPTTVVISSVLSFVITFVGGLLLGLYSSWTEALWAAVVTVAISNGLYNFKVQTQTKANREQEKLRENPNAYKDSVGEVATSYQTTEVVEYPVSPEATIPPTPHRPTPDLGLKSPMAVRVGEPRPELAGIPVILPFAGAFDEKPEMSTNPAYRESTDDIGVSDK